MAAVDHLLSLPRLELTREFVVVPFNGLKELLLAHLVGGQ